MEIALAEYIIANMNPSHLIKEELQNLINGQWVLSEEEFKLIGAADDSADGLYMVARRRAIKKKSGRF